MGESKVVICRDCEEYFDIGKLPISKLSPLPHIKWMGNESCFDEEWKRKRIEKMLTFMIHHRGHNLTMVGEYAGGYQEDEYLSTVDMQEFGLDND